MKLAMRKLAFPFVVISALVWAASFAAQAQTEKIIHSFAGGSADGATPGPVVLDSKGNLYGVTESGGANSAGMFYELSPSGSSWIETILYSFTFNLGDLYLPNSNLVFDAKGNLYGIAPLGGAFGSGGVFQLSPGTNGTWTEQVIYSFTGGNDVVSFQTALAIDGAGDLYGFRAGPTYGGIFQLHAGTNGVWTEKVLHNFSGNDGSAPYGGRLTIDAAGNLYGMAALGPNDFGLVFELVRGTGGSWTEKVLKVFKGGADGTTGYSVGLSIDASGNVFGASLWSVFELVPGSNGTWTEKILHNFTGGKDGAFPSSGTTLGPNGVVYGLTNEGGSHFGIIYSLTPQSNGTWSEKILHKFSTTGGDIFNPAFLPVVVDGQGNLYGAGWSGGASGFGAVFAVTP